MAEKMNIRKYEIFLKVTELGSITRAAEALETTQSGVSRMNLWALQIMAI